MFPLSNGAIPYGYRTANSLIGPIYNDDGIPYGTWYVGGQGDANHLRFTVVTNRLEISETSGVPTYHV